VKCANGKRVKHTQNVARAMLLTFVGPSPTRGHEASHLNHDPFDCRLENLTWETREANLSRRIAPPDGMGHHNAKLGIVDAYNIYRLYHSRALSMGKLAHRYGVAKPTIQHLVTGKTWMSYQARFAALLADGAETYSSDSSDIEDASWPDSPDSTDADNSFAQPTIVNCFTIAAAEMLAALEDDTDTDATDAQPIIVNCFTLAGEEMLNALSDDDDELCLPSAFITAAAPPPAARLHRRF
jgi:hypothetical protein